MSIALDHYVKLGFLIQLHKAFTATGTGLNNRLETAMGHISDYPPTTVIKTRDYCVLGVIKPAKRDGEDVEALYLTVTQGNGKIVGLLPYRPTNRQQQLLALSVCDSYLEYLESGSWPSVTRDLSLSGSAKRHCQLNQNIKHVLDTNIDTLLEHFGPVGIRHSLDKVVNKYRKSINRNSAFGNKRGR